MVAVGYKSAVRAGGVSDVKIYNIYGQILVEDELATIKATMEAAVLRGADLSGADLSDAVLRGAVLRDAVLSGAVLSDAGHDSRGYRFWAWRNADGVIIYRAGCRAWDNIDAAREHYGAGYASDGNPAECLARLEVLYLASREEKKS